MNASTLSLCTSFVVGVAAGAGFVLFYDANTSCFRSRATGITPVRRHSLSASKEKSSVAAAVNDEIVAEQFTQRSVFRHRGAEKSRRRVRRCYWTGWSRKPCAHAPALWRFEIASR